MGTAAAGEGEAVSALAGGSSTLAVLAAGGLEPGCVVAVLVTVTSGCDMDGVDNGAAPAPAPPACAAVVLRTRRGQV